MEEGKHIPRNRLRDGWQENLKALLAEAQQDDLEPRESTSGKLDPVKSLESFQDMRRAFLEEINPLRIAAGEPPLE